MKKQFKRFKGKALPEFKENMINYWMEDECISREKAIEYYVDDSFEELCKRLDQECFFIPDLGYKDNSINGLLCFEEKDNNFCIPIWLLEITEE